MADWRVALTLSAQWNFGGLQIALSACCSSNFPPTPNQQNCKIVSPNMQLTDALVLAEATS